MVVWTLMKRLSLSFPEGFLAQRRQPTLVWGHWSDWLSEVRGLGFFINSVFTLRTGTQKMHAGAQGLILRSPKPSDELLIVPLKLSDPFD
jgi:hypothetical protein